MERAVNYAPFPKEFPVAKTSPVWISHTLQYAMTGGYYSASSGSSTPTQDTSPSSNDGNQGFVQVPDNGPP
jgi:hypothetical protein